MKITITVTVDDEDADPNDRTGITNDLYERLTDFDTGLPATYGFDDVTITKAYEQ